MPVKIEKVLCVIGEVLFWTICIFTLLYVGGHVLAWIVRVQNGGHLRIEIIGN